MATARIEWGNATLQWEPEQSLGSARFVVPAYLGGYAAAMLNDGSLFEALARIIRGSATFAVRVHAENRMEVGGGVGVEPGEIRIVADRFTDAFDPAELRECVQYCADQAVTEGDRRAEQDARAARGFLDALAKDG